MILADALVWVRGVHIAATAAAAGTLVFVCFTAAPVFAGRLSGAAILRFRLLRIAAIALTVALVSGAAWIALQIRAMSSLFAPETGFTSITWTVIADTRFGQVNAFRAALALLVAAYLAWVVRVSRAPSAIAMLAATAATVICLGSLALLGHAGAAAGRGADLHLASDVVHLIAVGAWAGGLLPLLVFLGAALQGTHPGWGDAARKVTLRFSTLGLTSVALILASGLANAWFSMASVEDLVGTPYGRVLLAKVGLFALMVGVATVNRFVLTPRLPQPAALRQLRIHCAIELMLGATIIMAAAALGMLAPPAHVHE